MKYGVTKPAAAVEQCQVKSRKELYHHLKLTIDMQASPENPLVQGLGKKSVKMDNG